MGTSPGVTDQGRDHIHNSPQEQRQKCRRDNNRLDQEQYPQFLNRHQAKTSLKDPIDHETQQSGSYSTLVIYPYSVQWEHTIYACVLGELIWEVLERGPDGFETVLQETTGLDTEDCSPHECDKGCWFMVRTIIGIEWRIGTSNYDGWVASYHAEGCANENGVCYVVFRTHL